QWLRKIICSLLEEIFMSKAWKSIFVVLAWLTFACVTLQTFLAGAAVFTDPTYWRHHITFVHFFEWLPILMVILSFPAKLPNAMKWQSAAIFLLIFAQYFTANFQGAGAVHPVLALVMF